MTTPKANWIAIAAMAENRVIGNGNAIPWRLQKRTNCSLCSATAAANSRAR